MPEHKLHLAVAALLVSLLPVVAAGAAKTEPGEIWEMTSSMRMEGMSMPGRKATQCIAISQKNVAPEQPEGSKCTMTGVSQTPTSSTARMSCTGQMSMEGTFTRTGNTTRGEMKANMEGQAMQMIFEGTNTRKACQAMTAEGAQEMASAAKANADAMQSKLAADRAKQCSDYANGDPHVGVRMYFGRDAQCSDAAGKKSVCGRLSGESGYNALITLRSEYQNMASAVAPADRAALVNYEAEASRACGVTAEAVLPGLCRTAESRRSWQFLAERCPAEAKVLAAAQCAGRSYTAMPADSPVRAFCGFYASANPSGAGAMGQPQAAAAAAQQQSEQAQPSTGEKAKKTLRGLKDRLGL